MPEKLSEAAVRALTFEGKPKMVRDAKVTELMVAVNKTNKSYKVQRDLWQGQRGQKRLVKTVSHTLGGTDEMTLEDARSRALKVRAAIEVVKVSTQKALNLNRAFTSGRANPLDKISLALRNKET